MTDDYSTIDSPYDALLTRVPLDGDNGNVNNQPVKSGGNMADIYVDTFIKSTNYAPKTTGFYIDGLSGHAEFCDVYVAGNIQAITGQIGGFAIGATNLSVVAGGNTVTISSGTTAFAAGPTGSPTVTISQAGLLTVSNINITGGTINIGTNAKIDASGNATFIGISSLNVKTTTDFENVANARFGKATGGGGTATTTTYGLGLQPTNSATAFAAVTWFQNYDIFANSPTFSAVVRIVSSDSMGGQGTLFVGLGTITTTGGGNTWSGKKFCGFEFEKAGGSISVYARQNDGNGDGGAISGVLTTVSDLDSIDLILKMNGSSSIDYYFRKNTGSISAATNIATRVPTSGETDAYFSVNNRSTAYDFNVAIVSASYER